MEKIDQLLKQYLQQKPRVDEGSRFLPDEAHWHRFFENELSDDELAQMSAYLASDTEARAFALKTRRLLAEMPDTPPAAPKAWVDKAMKTVAKPSKKAPKKSFYVLWYAIAALAFVLSFGLPRYYMQLLVVTVLAGMKGIMGQRQAKMQILIYQALESGKEIDPGRLKELGLKK